MKTKNWDEMSLTEKLDVLGDWLDEAADMINEIAEQLSMQDEALQEKAVCPKCRSDKTLKVWLCEACHHIWRPMEKQP